MQATFPRAVFGLPRVALRATTRPASSYSACSAEPLPDTRYTTAPARLALRPRTCCEYRGAFRRKDIHNLQALGIIFHLHIKNVSFLLFCFIWVFTSRKVMLHPNMACDTAPVWSIYDLMSIIERVRVPVALRRRVAFGGHNYNTSTSADPR